MGYHSRTLPHASWLNALCWTRASALPSAAKVSYQQPSCPHSAPVSKSPTSLKPPVYCTSRTWPRSPYSSSSFWSKGEGIRRVRRSSESNADTIVVIDTLVRMQGEQEILCYIEICREMESCEAFFIYCRCSTGTQRLFTGIVKAWRR
ncbi:hypothetical protein ARMGADRAFT_608888 [Armillaria gallica]|uniref:Uncharacterized protein n=1 Tax=Armillaria gallica TaxID=47427 RepID=A0A2H3CMX5_ARMGA|nr:hypothetical protein ARMGADRAFT_608888 [Armillaria gallica]